MFGFNLAGIQYWGEEGITQECLDAIIRLIQYNDRITDVSILSSRKKNCLLVTINSGDLIAIKSGFATGYNGEGPRKFSYALGLLSAHKIEIDEYEVKNSVLDRLDASALTRSDIRNIKSTKPVRPQRYHEYIYDEHFDISKDENFWKSFRPVIPFAIIDNRIIDLAISFWENPDHNLMVGYKRLEDVFRKRTNLNHSYGGELFFQSFGGNNPKLYWKDLGDNERIARAYLFKNAYTAYRNPRMHTEKETERHEYLSEFLLLNHLYRLEKQAISML